MTRACCPRLRNAVASAVDNNGVLALSHGYALPVSYVHNAYRSRVCTHVPIRQPKHAAEQHDAHRRRDQDAELFMSAYDKIRNKQHIGAYKPPRRVLISIYNAVIGSFAEYSTTQAI